MNAVGDRVAIGAVGNDGNGSVAGHVRIYAWNGNSWTQQGQDIDGEAAYDGSGTSVSMNAAGDLKWLLGHTIMAGMELTQGM